MIENPKVKSPQGGVEPTSWFTDWYKMCKIPKRTAYNWWKEFAMDMGYEDEPPVKSTDLIEEFCKWLEDCGHHSPAEIKDWIKERKEEAILFHADQLIDDAFAQLDKALSEVTLHYPYLVEERLTGYAQGYLARINPVLYGDTEKINES